MRGIASILLAVAIGLGLYYYYLKQVQPAGSGTLATQAISTTGVQNDLLSIAQAERTYLIQNGNYASLDELVSSGMLTMTRTGRDGYTYTVETSERGFTVTARYSGPLHSPTITIDQNMEIRHTN